MIKRNLYFENLDGLRFFSFLAIFFYHVFYTSDPGMEQNPVYKFFYKIALNGDLGVNCFFVLSGFLITYLLLSEKMMNGKIDFVKFYIRRALRIWPLYFFCVIFGFYIFPRIKLLMGGVPSETAQLSYFLFFLPNFNNIANDFPDSSILGALWSVGIEEQFYFVWPFILAYLPSRHYMKFFAGLILSSVIFRACHTYAYRILDFHTMSVISDMGIGGMCAYLSIGKDSFRSYFKNMKRKTIVCLYLAGAVLLYFRYLIFRENMTSFVFERIVLSVFFAFIILEQTYSDNSFFKVGRWRIITKLGTYTYSLYCLHFIGILTAVYILKYAGVKETLLEIFLWLPILAFILSMVIGWLSYHYFESYFLRLKEKFSYIVKKEQEL